MLNLVQEPFTQKVTKYIVAENLHNRLCCTSYKTDPWPPGGHFSTDFLISTVNGIKVRKKYRSRDKIWVNKRLKQVGTEIHLPQRRQSHNTYNVKIRLVQRPKQTGTPQAAALLTL